MAEPSGTEKISPTERFSDNGDGTVTDNITGLQWQRGGEGGLRDYEDAEEYVCKLNLGDHGYWRLPNAEEIMDLAGIGHRQLQKVFPNIRAEGYWAKPTFHDRLLLTFPESMAYAVDFDPKSRDYGRAITTGTSRGYGFWVRAVRKARLEDQLIERFEEENEQFVNKLLGI